MLMAPLVITIGRVLCMICPFLLPYHPTAYRVCLDDASLAAWGNITRSRCLSQLP